uniref:Uncharacterized protein n=1 Tax=Corethron hystrix TaxID=216773 RepID=A0A7S1FW96_9STRA|mmetsp:Transcript_32877/g.75661  ORF Transcript_32877/g.75661 Transcript_32877/m.75661 type:complete len:976 (+) Transcript_32877:260-3187(+)|eukprot:CAMPEP_0113306892 /NCGR_PEP_ID=MMETSP0010_2-20120614/5965_1 /TAXON_ID=216773 ORGANISM="Corethron hystrix, Strain 308" /NCGR_SAMPLE_ID=MMETSP0010_2 /ASSEMBLY_ACC=CAM_ASM_000155 /LENGTH=975 /DNA_ID=CAMNT_0000161657 /DNA_START=247 /DNA_END=3174 /DNA_ORIENTATION=- /assembly_acc=CAM_ASM_000155
MWDNFGASTTNSAANTGQKVEAFLSRHPGESVVENRSTPVLSVLDEISTHIEQLEEFGNDKLNGAYIELLKKKTDHLKLLLLKSFENNHENILSSPQSKNANFDGQMHFEDADKAVKYVSFAVFIVWIAMVLAVYAFSPIETLRRTNDEEFLASIIEGALLFTQLIISIITLAGKCKQVSGFFVGALVTQFVAGATSVIFAFCKVPVLIDPITKCEVFLIRWCEWIPLAFLMAFLVDIISAENLNQSLSTGLSQGLSASAGILLPLSPNAIIWTVIMLVSILLYSKLFLRAFQKHRDYRESLGTGFTFEEKDHSHRAQLAATMMSMCAVLWLSLVVCYFLEWVILLHTPSYKGSFGFVNNCLCNVLSKLFFLHAITEVHSELFDRSSRNEGRLVELRQMLSIVWENSSDVLAISNLCSNGTISTKVSPTYFSLVGLPEIDTFTVEQPISDFNPSEVGSSSTNIDSTGKVGINLRKTEICELMKKAWNAKPGLILYDILHEDGTIIKCEAQASRLNNVLLAVIIRDITERQRRFDAEKLAVSEATARLKDAEVNRFTRHEVKNGLLAAIGICDGLQEAISSLTPNTLVHNSSASDTSSTISNTTHWVKELDATLNDVLEMILFEAMARDLVHGVYNPQVETINLVDLFSHLRGYEGDRFPIFTSPSPLPSLQLDPHVMKYIHLNAVTNACKYGKKGGIVRTDITYSAGQITVEVINEPGPEHDKLISICPKKARNLVFSSGKRLHSNISSSANRRVSAGDGAWIMHKCSVCLKGECDIQFKTDRTVFKVCIPVNDAQDMEKLEQLKKNTLFKIPPRTWGVAIDDSVIQRKLMDKFFSLVGLSSDRIVVQGANPSEILGFVEKCTKIITDNPTDHFLIIVDENLEVVDDGAHHITVSGSKYVEQIRNSLDFDLEKNTLMVIRSASDSASDVAIYEKRAHGFLSKAPVHRVKAIELIQPLWVRRFGYESVSSSEDELT